MRFTGHIALVSAICCFHHKRHGNRIGLERGANPVRSSEASIGNALRVALPQKDVYITGHWGVDREPDSGIKWFAGGVGF